MKTTDGQATYFYKAFDTQGDTPTDITEAYPITKFEFKMETEPYEEITGGYALIHMYEDRRAVKITTTESGTNIVARWLSNHKVLYIGKPWEQDHTLIPELIYDEFVTIVLRHASNGKKVLREPEKLLEQNG